MSISNRFVPVDLNFFGHKKTKRLFKLYPALADHIIICLWRLWIQCHFDYQDGKLKMEAEEIEEMIDWAGDPGKFVEILTNEKTQFIDKTPEKEEYCMHNWYRRNPIFNPEKKKAISEKKSEASHIGWWQKEKESLDKRGITFENCEWLEKNEKGRLGVIDKNVPAFMELKNEIFYSREEFLERNTWARKPIQNARRDLIKKHTKLCKKCKQPHVSTESKLCYDCDKSV